MTIYLIDLYVLLCMSSDMILIGKLYRLFKHLLAETNIKNKKRYIGRTRSVDQIQIKALDVNKCLIFYIQNIPTTYLIGCFFESKSTETFDKTTVYA